MTHTAKHTPGPWVLSEGNECIYVRSNVHPNAIAAVEYDFNSDIDDTTEEAQANAHLISAAPAMYEALRSIPDHALDCKHSYPHTLACWNCIVKAALAQAEARS